MNGKCLYAHCYGHCSNLAVTDPIKSVQCVTDSLDVKLESCWLKSHAKKHKVRQNKSQGKNVSRGVHALCPTRWTVCGEALAEVFNNHAELMELWDWSLTVSKDTEMKANIRGV